MGMEHPLATFRGAFATFCEPKGSRSLTLLNLDGKERVIKPE
jgi:hypothetical protein